LSLLVGRDEGAPPKRSAQVTRECLLVGRDEGAPPGRDEGAPPKRSAQVTREWRLGHGPQSKPCTPVTMLLLTPVR
jgi:hypothetical protein